VEGGGKGERREENELTDPGHVQQYFQIHQQFIDIPVEDDQLSLAQGEPPVRVRRGDHTALASSEETVAGQLHIQRQTGEQNTTIREQTTGNQPGKSTPLPAVGPAPPEQQTELPNARYFSEHLDAGEDVSAWPPGFEQHQGGPTVGVPATLATHLWGSVSFKLLVRM